MMGVSTARDALTAELLGDVGKLCDKVGEVGVKIDELPERLAVTSRMLEEQTGIMIEAQDRLISRINSFVSKKADAAAAKCVADVESQIRSLVNGAIQESLGDPLAQTISNIKSVTNEAQNSIKATENHIEKVAEKTWFKTAWWALFAGIIGGIAAPITLLIFGK